MKTIEQLKKERQDLLREVAVPKRTLEMLDNAFFKKREEWLLQQAPDMGVADDWMIIKYPEELAKSSEDYKAWKDFIKSVPREDIDNILVLTDEEIRARVE